MTLPNDISRGLIAWSGALALHLMAGTAVYLQLIAPHAPSGPPADIAGPLTLRLSPSPSPSLEHHDIAPRIEATDVPLATAVALPALVRPGPTAPGGGAAGRMVANSVTTSGTATAPRDSAGADASALEAQFLDLVAAHIERHRAVVAADHATGVVWLRILLQRDGHVARAWVDHGSGNVALDARGLATVHQAEPLPQIPPAMPAVIDLTVPIEFGNQL